MNLEALWYLVIGLSITLYAVLDGFDLGVGALHLFAKGDIQRRIFLNAIGPVWDGNEVWIVVVMGGLFAGFPSAYAAVFSGFYTLLMFLIAGLMFRAAAIEFRSKGESRLWRSFWDAVFCIASILVAFVLGLVLGNLIEGVPLDASQNFSGTLFDFLRPYSALVGLTAVALFAMHGAIYLVMKTEGETHALVRHWVDRVTFSFLACYVLLTLATLFYMPHMVLRMEKVPLLFLFPLFSFFAILNTPFQIRKERFGWAFVSSSLAIASLLALYALGTYPILVLSHTAPAAHSLTIYNAASSHKTLTILLTVVALGVPLVLAYGFWVYRIFRGKVRLEKTGY